MAKVIIFSNTDGYYSTAKKALNILREEKQLTDEAAAFLITDNDVWDGYWEKQLDGCEVVLLDWMGVTLETTLLEAIKASLEKKGIPFKMRAGDEAEGNASYGFEPKDHVTVMKYAVYGGVENFKNLWLWLLNRFCFGEYSCEEPQQMLWNGIYRPEERKPFTSLGEYWIKYCNDDYPTIGLIFYRNEWLLENLAYQRAIIKECEKQKINIIPIFSHGVKNPEMGAPGLEDAIRKYFMKDGKAVIDCVINTIKFSLTASASIELRVLEDLNVPLLQAYTMMRSIEEWQENIQGLSAVEVAISVTMPEFDGAIHSVPIAGKYRDADNIVYFKPMYNRVARLISKAKKWAKLRRKQNSDKKLAVIFHNYPPKNSNIGTALGMDSPESVRLLLAALKNAGYFVDHIPEDSKTFMEELIKCATNDRRFMNEEQIEKAIGKVTIEEYKKLFDAIPQEVQNRMVETWGSPLGDVFNYDDKLLIPGMTNGNIIITVQPPRGFGEDSGKIYHDPVAPPTHHYLAVYYWIREIYKADAVIHVGTHGSVEWLPGKAAGLSESCYSDICLGDLPNLYHYIVTVIGEGIQAKRRSAACLVDYLTPPMSTSGLYDSMAELEALLDEYLDFKDNEQDKLNEVAQLIREKATECNLNQDIPEGDSFEEYVCKLHNYLTDIKNMQIRVGLHILGEPPVEKHLTEYLVALSRLENGKVPSLAKVLARNYGYDYYELLENSAVRIPALHITYGKLADKIREQSMEIIEFLAARKFNEARVNEVLSLRDYALMPEGLQEEFLNVCTYICTDLYPNLQATVAELNNTLRGLAGEFINPSVAGAPTNGRADVLPTGRNFYGVDPQTLPTKVAWEVGKARAEGVVEAYIADEGKYPETIGMVMGSDMRTHGVCFAQFLYLMGMRPIWQKGSGRVLGIEPMTMEELKRPRIDATARITGMMRDSMPCVVDLLDKAAKMCAELDEDDDTNFVRKHVREDVEYLKEQGIDTMDASKQAMYRIFGCPPGGYGAGVAYVLEEKNWENLDDLANVYVRWGAHVYGEGENGKYMPELFKRRLSKIDATVMGIDNREINLLSADDFNSYHGGLIASVRSYSGKMPRTYCADSTDQSHVVIRTIHQEIKRVFRGEIMNPKFIDGMKEHGYKGAADMGNYVAHCYQWDATSDTMEDWMYDDLAKKYALDPEIKKWMEEVNPWALHRIAEVLLEAEQRQMWNAKPEIKAELQKLLLAMEGEMEERSE
ncbi:MAG: cobaltochelatase subunit CobN [Phascolarctobacterium sp.]|nr:cobaltochelatase subunit CobN [Phascolarctobacterium sp.]